MPRISKREKNLIWIFTWISFKIKGGVRSAWSGIKPSWQARSKGLVLAQSQKDFATQALAKHQRVRPSPSGRLALAPKRMWTGEMSRSSVTSLVPARRTEGEDDKWNNVRIYMSFRHLEPTDFSCFRGIFEKNLDEMEHKHRGKRW